MSTITPGTHFITRREAEDFRRAIHGHKGVVVLTPEEAHDALKMLRDAGFTITFPEERYYVKSANTERMSVTQVCDRRGGQVEAIFYGLLGVSAAWDYADRLNREARP